MILTLSPSGLNTYQACPRKFNYSNMKRLRPLEEKRDKLDRGSLFHRMLEVHYNGLINKTPFNDIVIEVTNFAREAYRNDEYEDIGMVESCIANYQEYAVFYSEDGWEPISTETPFSKIIFENNEHKIVLEGIVDLIAKNRNSTSLFVVDHKTSDKNDLYPTILGNQFKAYSWATDSFVVIKNDIGFQKTYGPAQRFHRHVLNYTKEHLDEWRESVIYHGLELINFIEKDYFPMRESSCYNCQYRKICESTPDAREYKINSMYKVGEPHDIFSRR